MGQILILPDVHGRQFWKDACFNHKDEFEKIVFLGDYLSPYPYEEITNKQAIDVFREVLDFKKENPDKVALLIGNHDLSYFNTGICECRTDFKNWDLINGIFCDNIKLFNLAWETTINGKRYFFSHAGVKKAWLKLINGYWFKMEDENELPDARLFDNFFHVAYDDGGNDEAIFNFEGPVSAYSSYRGWGGFECGSIVWADIREYGEKEFENVVFVCGHTQLDSEPIISDWVMDLDCRRPFVLDTDTGEVKEYKPEE